MSKDNMYLQSLQTVLVSFALEPCSKKWWISHVVVELVQGGPSAAGSSVPGATEWDGLAGLVRGALYTPPPIPTGLLLDSQNPTGLD